MQGKLIVSIEVTQNSETESFEGRMLIADSGAGKLLKPSLSPSCLSRHDYRCNGPVIRSAPKQGFPPRTQKGHLRRSEYGVNFEVYVQPRSVWA